MYQVSDEYLEAVKGQSRYFFTRVKFDGMTEYITDENIRFGSYTDIVDANNVISMGNACSKKIEMTIINFTQPYVWKGSHFIVEKGLKVNGECVWIPWGAFWVTDMSTSNDNRTIKLTAYDYMFKLSKREYVTELVAPFHYRDLLDEFLEKTGMTLSATADLPNRDDADYTILSWPDTDFTYSDIAGHLAGMIGCNARISKADPTVIEFVWYTATGTKIKETLYQDGFEKLSDGPLRVDFFVTGSNKEIEIENTEEITDGELDFRPFDSSDPADYPWLIFSYDDVNLTASVSINPDYAADTQPIGIPYSLNYNGQIYDVTTIPEKGFEGCKATEIELPSTLTTIGRYAFYGCRNLTEITIPENVKTVYRNILWDCKSLEVIYFNAVECRPYTTNSFPFGSINSDKKVSLVIGAGITTLYRAIFYGASISSVFIPEGVQTIGKDAFFDCDGLTTVVIPSTVTSMSSDTFGWCSNLTSIIVNKPADSLANAPWGASSATITWLG